MRGTISKISTTTKDHAMRTPIIDGEFSSLPEKGKSFRMFSESLTEGANLRVFVTSQVTSVNHQSHKTLRFETVNSVYELELFDACGAV